MAQRKLRHTIGLILSNVSNDFSGHLIEEMGEQLHENGYRLIITTTNHNIEHERDMLSMFSKTTDGILIISDAADYEELADAVPSRIPVIFLNRKPRGCPHTCILENDYSAVFQAVLSNSISGNDKIALVHGNKDFSTTQEILNAYENAMASTPVGYHEDWIYDSGHAPLSPGEIVADMEKKGCNTVFTCTQTLTRQFLDYLLIYNFSAQKPVTLIGFSNKDTESNTQLSFDTITQPLQELAELSVQQMLYLIKSPGTPVREYLLKGTLRTKALNVLNNEKNQEEL